MTRREKGVSHLRRLQSSCRCQKLPPPPRPAIVTCSVAAPGGGWSSLCCRKMPLPPSRSTVVTVAGVGSLRPLEVAAGAAAKPVQRPSLFHFCIIELVTERTCSD